MLEKFKKHLELNLPFLVGSRLLIAVSGGIDSMVCLHLLQQLQFNIAVAHCNFQLRGYESLEDALFVEKYTSSHNIPLYSVSFDTKLFVKEKGLSTQVAARKLRYDWFYELVELYDFDYIITAHHADDSMESFFINLSRGTGLEGLIGIPVVNDKVIRPLLPFDRATLHEYATEHSIIWREDSSNATDDYLRNKIRHAVTPVLKELQPQFTVAFLKTQTFLKDSQALVNDAVKIVYEQVVMEREDAIEIDLELLINLQNYKSYLYYWLKIYGFTSWEDIFKMVHSKTGKVVYSPSHILLKDRSFLIVRPFKEQETEVVYEINWDQRDVKLPLNITFCRVTNQSQESKSVIFVDENELKFPLTLQKWKVGDRFYPKGMNGKSKKVSKFLKDKKISLLEKDAIWTLASKNKIVWIIGYRQDERFIVKPNTKNILKIEFTQ